MIETLREEGERDAFELVVGVDCEGKKLNEM